MCVCVYCFSQENLNTGNIYGVFSSILQPLFRPLLNINLRFIIMAVSQEQGLPIAMLQLEHQHVGAWLWATPNSNLGLAMPQKEFVISSSLWLRVPLFALNSTRCSCNQWSDCLGDHLLGCGQRNWRTRRHDALCSVFLHALSVDNANC